MYRAAIIGAGAIAGLGQPSLHDDSLANERPLSSHAGGYDAVDDIELVAVADPGRDSLDQFGEIWDIDRNARYLDHEEMLARESIDVVSVCSPTALHHEHVLDVVESEAEPSVIWCEKPIACSLSEADDMIEMTDDTGAELVINHSYRFMEKVVALRRLMRDEELIGDVRSVHTRLSMELLRNGTHLLDTISFLCDVNPAAVSGYISSKSELDIFQAEGELDDAGGGGFVVTNDGTFITIDAVTSRQISTFCFEFVGTEGKVYLNFDDGEWRYWALQDGQHVETPLPTISEGWTWADDYPTAFPNAVTHVVDLIEGDATNRSTGEEATEALEQIIGFFISHFTRSHVSLPIQSPLREVHVGSW